MGGIYIPICLLEEVLHVLYLAMDYQYLEGVGHRLSRVSNWGYC